jgi:histidinol-phosphate aminotransferase
VTVDWGGLLRPEVLALRAYGVEDPGGLVKLDANENPYPIPAPVLARIAERVRELELNRYPDPEARRLRGLLARRFDWPVEGVLLGNGSDELIVLLLAACGADGATLLVPAPTFSMYRHIALVSGWRVAEVPLTGRFGLDGEAMAAEAGRVRPRLTALATPNNPTGNRFDEGTVRQLLAAVPGILVLDEAYHDFAGGTSLGLARENARVVVLRTLSKVGMAALRVGVLLADPALARELDKVRLPYNLSSFSQLAAVVALEEPAYLATQVAAIVAERARVAAALAATPGVEAFPSDANFILFRTGRPSREVFAGLRAGGVLVRDLGHAPGLLERCLRVTIGTPEENDRFLGALPGALGG